MHLQIVKKYNYTEVEIKHGVTRHTVLIDNQFSCDCSSLQIANCKTCHRGKSTDCSSRDFNANAFKGINKNF